MSARSSWLLATLVVVAGCSSKSGESPSGHDSAAADEADASEDAAPAAGSSTVVATMVDYETLSPVKGLTVTGGGQTTTTDANGQWQLTVPTGSTLQANVTGAKYSQILFPDFTIDDASVDLSTIVIPDTSTFTLAESTLSGFDATKALVWLVVLTEPSCASAAGGTVSVSSPSGAAVAYFDTNALPNASSTSFQAVKTGRPVAAVYNVDPSGAVAVSVTHPTCTMVPFPAAYQGRTYTGAVRLAAAQGGNNSAMVVVLR